MGLGLPTLQQKPASNADVDYTDPPIWKEQVLYIKSFCAEPFMAKTIFSKIEENQGIILAL